MHLLIHSVLVRGPCAIEGYDGLVSKLLPVLPYPLKAPHRCTCWQSRGQTCEQGNRQPGSDILGQEVLCWQLSCPGESFQCHS